MCLYRWEAIVELAAQLSEFHNHVHYCTNHLWCTTSIQVHVYMVIVTVQVHFIWQDNVISGLLTT